MYIVIGVSVAFHLTRAGAQVKVIEATRIDVDQHARQLHFIEQDDVEFLGIVGNIGNAGIGSGIGLEFDQTGILQQEQCPRCIGGIIGMPILAPCGKVAINLYLAE